MSGGRTVIVDREAGAERLLELLGTVAGQTLELALDTDTREKYDALVAKSLKESSSEKGAWIIKLYKAVGVAVACVLCLVMLRPQGATEYVPPLDLTKEIVIMWGKEHYRSINDGEIIENLDLPEEITEESVGEILTYLRICGQNQYESVSHETAIILYSYEGKEEIGILYDRENWIYMIRVQK